MTATTTPIANRLGFNSGWKNPTPPSILLNTKDTSSRAFMQAELIYLKSYLLIKEYLRFQQINLIEFDIKAATPYKKIIYLTLYQHMLYNSKEDLYTDLKFLWFNKQALQQRHRYNLNTMYNFNALKTLKKAVKIKEVLWYHRVKVRGTLLRFSKEWQHLQLRYLRRKSRTWYRRRNNLKFISHKKIIKNQLKNKLKMNRWLYCFEQKPSPFKKIHFKNKKISLKRLKFLNQKYRRLRYFITKEPQLKKNFIGRLIKNFRKLKKYRKKLFATINKKNRRFFKDIRPFVNKKSKDFVTQYSASFLTNRQRKTWIFQNENTISQNKVLKNIFNTKYLKTHLKIFIEFFLKNWIGIDYVIKFNQRSKNIYVKKAITGLSTVNLELKRINKLDYFKRLAYVFISAHNNQNPQIIADLIAREVELTREFKHFCYNIDLIFSAFMSGFLKSYRIVISGKTKRKDLRRDWEVIKYQKKDAIPRKQFNKRVLYALGVARNNRGQFGIKVWLYY